MAAAIQALSISRSVGERLPLQPAPGRVLAVFQRSCLLTIRDGGEPLSLVPPEIGDGPLNIVVEAKPPALVEIEVGISASVSRACLQVGPLTVDLSAARTWEPRPEWATLRATSWPYHFEEPCLWATKHRHKYSRWQSPLQSRSGIAASLAKGVLAPRNDVSSVRSGSIRHGETRNDGAEKRDGHARPLCWLDALQERLDQVGAAALRAAPPGSLLDLLTDGVAVPGAAQQTVLRAAREAVPLLAAGWVGDGRALARGAGWLAGLGGGLTPAGDDFLAGLMLRAWLAHPEPDAFCRHLLAAAAPRTTALSAAFLRAAARGECSAAWQALLLALAGAGPSQFDQAVCNVLAHGHTSGADMLAGFLCISAHDLLRDPSACGQGPEQAAHRR
jgi:hypothetical protein